MIALSGLPNKAQTRARKEENGVVLTLQLLNEELRDDFGCVPNRMHNLRIMVRNDKMPVALHRCNFMNLRRFPGIISGTKRKFCQFSYREPRFFRGRGVLKQVKVVQIPMTKADLFLRIFEAIPGTLKRFETIDVIFFFFAKMLFSRMIRY